MAVTKAVAKPAAKPAAKPVAKPAAMAVAKVAPKPVAKPAPKLAAKPVMAVAKPAPKPKPVMAAAKPVPKLASAAATGTVASIAIPGEQAPAILDGSLIGDVGFDPCFLSTRADSMANYFNGIFNGAVALDGLSWYREAELMHGRICMVAVLGFIAPGFGTLSGNEWTGVNAYSSTNPLEAISTAPGAAFFQIFAFMSLLEFRRISIITKEGSSYKAGGSQMWGQGGWNPLGLNYTPAEYAEKQLQEVKHARLAMIGLLGLIFQANASGVSVVDQLSAAIVAPDYYAKAGYFLPEGI